ncbi:MAG: type II CAAX prenyl endopeptidase Rce1 family protein [Lachnospirales bacterium]
MNKNIEIKNILDNDINETVTTSVKKKKSKEKKQKDYTYYSRLYPRWAYIFIIFFWFSLDYTGLSNAIKIEQDFGINTPSFSLVIPSLLAISLTLVFFRKDLIPKISKQIKEPSTYFYALIGPAIYIFSIIVLAIVSILIGADASTASENQETLNAIAANSNKVAYFFMVVILGPILEELVFRYALINIFDVRKKWLKWIPYVMSIFLFAGIHEIGFFVAPSAESFFSLLSYLTISTTIVLTYVISGRRLVSAIIIHIIINSFSIILGTL